MDEKHTPPAMLHARPVPVWALGDNARPQTPQAAVESDHSTIWVMPYASADDDRWRKLAKASQGLAVADHSGSAAVSPSGSFLGGLPQQPKRVLLQATDLEHQMDLSGDWNPHKDHSVDGEVGPRFAAAAADARFRGRPGSAPYDDTSSMSTLAQFHQTAELKRERRRQRTFSLKVTLLNNPYVPLTLRATMFALSVVALGLAASIFIQSRHYANTRGDGLAQQPSTIMAIAVQSAALVYLVYITYDEYSGKPLGLRNAKDKVKLIMLDLFFIIWSSANLSLTFNTLYDTGWICRSSAVSDEQLGYDPTPYSGGICSRQKGLAAFLFLTLFMWVFSFTVSIFRLVERVSSNR
ncbi:uncharacterized protein V1510DRAFT_408922 [Dipodascopsis tothii]|uniref:uncharacterized protein n=1 Tax=Dipodascopsis tothii TaxID=44089 RepID=UPI0034CF249F